MRPTRVFDFASFARATPRSTAGPGAGGRLSPRRWRRRGPGAREPWKFLCTPRIRRLTTSPQTLRAQAPAQRDLLLARARALGSLRLDDARHAFEARLGEEHRAAPSPELTLADVRVAVAVGAQRRLGVVEVKRTEASLADDLQAVVEDSRQALLAADVEPRGEEVAGVQAYAQAL